MNDRIEVLRGAVARGWCSPENAGKTVDPVLAEAIVQEVIAAIAASAEPVAWVAADTLNSPHPTCVSSLAYMSQLDKDRGREYVPLYAAPVAAQVPEGMIERIKAAEQRILDGHAPRRIPADPTDVDLVLAEVRLFLEGKPAPFWLAAAAPAPKEGEAP